MTKTNWSKRGMSPASDNHMREVAEALKVSTPTVSPHFADKISTPQIECINDRELTSIHALLAYVAYNQNVRQETVQMIVEAEFHVDHVAKLRRQDYMRAVEFLVDLKMDEVIN